MARTTLPHDYSPLATPTLSHCPRPGRGRASLSGPSRSTESGLHYFLSARAVSPRCRSSTLERAWPVHKPVGMTGQCRCHGVGGRRGLVALGRLWWELGRGQRGRLGVASLGEAKGPRLRETGSGVRVAEFAVRLRPGMRKAVPLGSFGEIGVEAA